MRPQFHFTPATGWINDPHGITARDGGYDVFYQYRPDAPEWGPDCHWGHARGADLFSLVEHEPAIYPGDGDDGIWTGSLVTDAGATRIFYTSVDRSDLAIGRVRVATPVDSTWDAWVKGDVVMEQPPGMELVGFRDPFIRRDPDTWRAFLGAGDTAGDALALSYTSPDLISWTYEGVALRRPSADRDPVWMGAMWECPQIFDLDGRHVMLSSAWDRDVLNYAGYAVGHYEHGVFTAESWGRLTYGPSFYAPSFFRDADGSGATQFWMRGIEDLDAGWASAHSIPYLLSLSGDVLVATPHPDLDAYLAPPSPDRHVAGTAADVRWTGGGSLSVSSGGRPLFTLERGAHSVIVVVGDERWELPHGSGEVRLIIDATALEVVTDLGVLGHAIPAPDAALDVEGEGVVVRALVRKNGSA